MRRPVGWVCGVVLAAACAVVRSRASAPAAAPDPLAAGLAKLRAGAADEAQSLLVEAGERYPVLADYALYFRARAAARAGQAQDVLDLARALLADHPDSIWRAPAALLAADRERAAGDLAGAARSLAAARAALPRASIGWARATLRLAEVDDRLGEAEAALDLAHDLRRTTPHGLGARRARRLTERIRRARPDLIVDHVDEAETRLREGDAAGARDETEAALVAVPRGVGGISMSLPPALRARALWVRAQAEHALGLADTAEATCWKLAGEAPDPLAPRGLAAAAAWRWNADDDARALRLFEAVLRRFPDAPQAAEALYGIGRIAQEAGRWAEARAAYTELAGCFPHAELTPEARWRAAWIRWLAGETALAEQAFARLAMRSRDAARIAAEYWRARALERLGRREEAGAALVHVADRHPTSYYAGLADERLGRPPPEGKPPSAVPLPPFPAGLPGVHAERARALSDLGLRRFARLELDALGSIDVPRRRLLQAYQAIAAFGPAVRLARAMRPRSPGPLRKALYPLAYWDTVRVAARAERLDPLLVVALMRQESLFDPDAVSPAGAHGLMQLLPATARTLADGLSPAALHDVGTNITLGAALLSRLLARYEGSTVKALAAYNGGADNVARWERRYGGREPDEFVELISFRETRDYVKAVLRNWRLYRRLYAIPSASTSSVGSPPKAPFDMTAMTSPGRAVAIR